MHAEIILAQPLLGKDMKNIHVRKLGGETTQESWSISYFILKLLHQFVKNLA
jgi:hypothetical protein